MASERTQRETYLVPVMDEMLAANLGLKINFDFEPGTLRGLADALPMSIATGDAFSLFPELRRHYLVWMQDIRQPLTYSVWALIPHEEWGQHAGMFRGSACDTPGCGHPRTPERFERVLRETKGVFFKVSIRGGIYFLNDAHKARNASERVRYGDLKPKHCSSQAEYDFLRYALSGKTPWHFRLKEAWRRDWRHRKPLRYFFAPPLPEHH